MRSTVPYTERLRVIASMIPPGSTVLDLGCGTGALSILLDSSATHHGLDRPEIDLDAEEWPDLPPHDVAVFSGVLEYLRDPRAVLARMTAPIVVASYSVRDLRLPQTTKPEWRNAYTSQECVRLAASAGYGVTDFVTFQRQKVARLERLQC